MGIGGVIGQDEAREWIGATKVAGATSGCGAASPEAGDFNGVSTVRYARFRSSRAAFWCTPQDAYSQSHWYENQDASDNEQDQIHYSNVIHLITTPPCLGFSS